MKTKTLSTVAQTLALASCLALSPLAKAATYVIDTEGNHAFIQFKIQHLGYSWLLGRFNEFEGSFDYDEKDPGAARIDITIDAASVDSNHGKRDKHLRSKDFLDVEKFPTARFVSSTFKDLGNGKGELKGQFTLRDVTRDITIDVKHVGAGDDPWGGYRRGFEGTTTIALKDYGIPMDLGPASQQVELFFSFEGIRK